MLKIIRAFLFLFLVLSWAACFAIGQSVSEKPEIPIGVRYQFASDQLNNEAKSLLEKTLAGDQSARTKLLSGGSLTCGPMLWQTIRVIADPKLVKAKPITIVVPAPTAVTTQARGFVSDEERQLFWSGLMTKYPALASAKVRKARARELNYYWATIPFDIEEPLYVLDTGSDVFVAHFFNDNGKLSLFWIDLVGELRALKPDAPSDETGKAITDKLVEEAESQSPEAMLRAGKAYLTGDGVPVNQERGKTLLDSAAQKGEVGAQLFLATAYFSGTYLPKNPAKAAPYFIMAADQGNAMAQFYVGMMHLYGTGLEKSPEKALPYLQKASDQKFAGAQYNLGAMYFLGLGVPQDKTQACALYAKAADQGFLQAINDLGWCYQHGDGVEKDAAKAMALYTKAAESGHLRGQGNLAMMYVASNEWEKAYVWLRIAETAGAAEASPVLQDVKKHLTQAQVDLAESKVSDWQKAHPRKQ